jgi:Methyltransferase domain
MKHSPRDQFLSLLRQAVEEGALVKLTLGKHVGTDESPLNLFVRPVALKSGMRLSFLWRYRRRDITKNYESSEALKMLDLLIGTEFLDAHLFTTVRSVQLETGGRSPRIHSKELPRTEAVLTGNDRQKARPIDPRVPWLHALGVTDARGKPLAAMTDKFRQIEKFAEILGHLIKEAPFPNSNEVRAFDMGCGKGYLTFAVSELLGDRGSVCGIEARSELVNFCSRTAAEQGLSKRLTFREGSISTADIGNADLLIALHACDTATDDAIAKGISAGATLIVVAPCCQKEVRPQLTAPPILAAALKHGIFQERQAEFVTDALRALILEWAGYKTRVMEFISTEHTAKNTMITAVKMRPAADAAIASKIRSLAAFYGVRHQSLAAQMGIALT